MTLCLRQSVLSRVCHDLGRRPFDNLPATCSGLPGSLPATRSTTNTHTDPTSARLSHQRGEFDHGSWVISVLRGLEAAKALLGEIRPRRSARRGGQRGYPASGRWIVRKTCRAIGDVLRRMSDTLSEGSDGPALPVAAWQDSRLGLDRSDTIYWRATSGRMRAMRPRSTTMDQMKLALA
jgi:hypothetical protein